MALAVLVELERIPEAIVLRDIDTRQAALAGFFSEIFRIEALVRWLDAADTRIKRLPTPLPLPLKLVKATGPVAPSDSATLTVRTIKGSTCSIDVQYDSGSSQAAGLDEQDTGDGTLVTWTWTVGSNTAAGRWPIYVTCVKDDRIGKLLTSILVK